MSIGPSFAPSYVGPGTYTKVVLQNQPPTALPPFVTALIGRTSVDKQTTKRLCRNAVAAQTVAVDPVTGILTITAGDVDETIRRDLLQADNTDIFAIDSNSLVTDAETFQQFLFGFSNDWVRADVGIKTYVEWVTDYGVKAVLTAPIFIGKAGVGSLAILLARATGDTLFTTPGTVTPVTIPDGSSIFRVTLTTGAYTLSVQGPTASGFGTPVTITAGGEFTVMDDGVGGSGGSVRVMVDATVLALAITVDGDYDNTVVLSTRGPRIGTATVTTVPRAVGGLYDVLYRVNKSIADFVPASYDSLKSVQLAHGVVTDATPVDALSVGAYPYFTEGGQTVFAVPLKDKNIVGPTDGYDLDEPTGTGYTAAVVDALVQLEDVADVCLVIVLSPTEAIGSGNFRPGILNAVLSHVNRMSDTPNRKPRMAVLGARAGTTNELVFSGTASTAQSSRIVYMAPSTATLAISGTTKIADGSTLAAALAGILSSGVDAGEPIMRKRFTSFVDVPDTAFTLTQKNRLAGTYGLTIVEKIGGAPTIRDFLTTNVTNELTGNAKVTVLEIDIRRSVQSALDATVIGTRLVVEQSLGEIRGIVEFVLARKRNAQIINASEVVKIEVDPTVKSQVNVELKVVPVFDTKWVFVNATFQTE